MCRLRVHAGCVSAWVSSSVSSTATSSLSSRRLSNGIQHYIRISRIGSRPILFLRRVRSPLLPVEQSNKSDIQIYRLGSCPASLPPSRPGSHTSNCPAWCPLSPLGGGHPHRIRPKGTLVVHRNVISPRQLRWHHSSQETPPRKPKNGGI